MRFIAALLAYVAIALTVAGCNLATDKQYMNEGAGVDLYTADRASQIELQKEYISFICAQAGSNCGGNWTAFVQAGMNDIDQRCDGYLTWLDARRRDKEPVLAELSALNTAAHAMMTVTGSSPKSLDIVTAAFGLASATYNNWNSRLMLAINQSTVQDVVYNSQGQFREKIRSYVVPDQPMAIYLLRNYLRLCMPITIEANINTTTTLVQRGAPIAALQGTVVRAVQPSIIRDVNAPLRRFVQPARPPSPTRLGRFETEMQAKDMKRAMDILGCQGADLGPVGSPARKALAKFLTDNGKASSDRVTNDVFFTLRELKADGKQGTCSG